MTLSSRPGMRRREAGRNATIRRIAPFYIQKGRGAGFARLSDRPLPTRISPIRQ
ncbi:MAG: hypothetical protein K2F71_03170 [Paramuribaculum sp.]|nr:hypothetical protein [Paramuribaculum sp.]